MYAAGEDLPAYNTRGLPDDDYRTLASGLMRVR